MSAVPAFIGTRLLPRRGGLSGRRHRRDAERRHQGDAQHVRHHRVLDELLERVVDTVISNRDRWLETMMNEELRLQPVENSAFFRSAAVIFIAALFIGHLIPLLPFVWLPRYARR